MKQLDVESQVDGMIEALRDERAPEAPEDPEAAELLMAMRLVKGLRRPAGASPDLGDRIEASIGLAMKPTARPVRKRWAVAFGTIAAAVALFVAFSVTSGRWNRDVAYAMSKAVSKVAAYHGVLAKSYSNHLGETGTIRRIEVWSSGDRYATRSDDGTLTVNNGERKWQVRPEDKTVAILPLLPDPYRSGLDLRDQAEHALQYPHSAVGEETIAGRKTVKLEVTPPGGLPYHLWIDAETNLPLQLQTAVQNGTQTTYTYTSFDVTSAIDQGIFTFSVPEGYTAVDTDPGQVVATPAEAQGIAGFAPIMPSSAPVRFVAFASGRIVLDYGQATVTEVQAKGDFTPAGYGALGTAAGGPLEILEDHLRWRQDGLEITVEGADGLELAKQLAPDLTLPAQEPGTAAEPKVKVPFDMEALRNAQTQVDGGHSPWQLDPLQVSLTFVNLQVTPGGIVGEPKVPYASFSLETSDGVYAVVKVSEGPTQRVYLERLVRQDETGIWSVVGYDPR